MEKKKIKIWKIILLCVVVIIIVFALITTRKVIIFNEINDKISKYEQSTNIYAKTDSEKSTIEILKLDDNKKTILDFKDKPIKIVQINEKGKKNNYTFNKNTNTVTISNGNDIVMMQDSSVVKNYAKTESLFQTILKSINAKINVENINGKEYYVIDSMMNDDYLTLQNLKSIKAYIDKETGLPLKLVETTKDGNEHIVSYEYKLNTVINDDFNAPDTTGYEEN